MPNPSPRPKEPQLISLDEIEETEIDWLWWPYFPFGMTSMLFGKGGIGKSHIIVDIASRVSTGAPFPGLGQPSRPPENVLMLSAEDDYSTVLRPRMRRAGGELERIYVPEELFTLDRRGMDLLDGYLHETGARFVSIDPVVHFMGGKLDMHKANEVRSLLGPLNLIAQRHRAAVIFVHHKKKGKDGDEDELQSGSADFTNASRSAVFVTHSNDGTTIMRHVKHNNSPKGSTWAFSFGDSAFEWQGTYDDGSDLFMPSSSPAGRRPVARNRAETFLRDLLAAGPVRAAEIEAAARREGISKRTLDRAKIGTADSFMRHEDGRMVWYWRLWPGAGDGDGEKSPVGRDSLPATGEAHGPPPPAPDNPSPMEPPDAQSPTPIRPLDSRPDDAAADPARGASGGRMDPRPGRVAGEANAGLAGDGPAGAARRPDGGRGQPPAALSPAQAAAAFLARRREAGGPV